MAGSALAEDDKGLLTRLLEDQLSSSGSQVEIEGFEGALSTRATIKRLSVSDDAGEWMIMRDLTLDWDRSALLARQVLDVQELSAGEIILLRAPSRQLRPPRAQASPLQIPELPVAIDIDRIEASHVRLAEAYLGTDLTLSVSGSAQLDGQNFEILLDASRHDGRAGRFSVEMRHQDGQLGLDLALSEAEGGALATLLDLRGKPALQAQLQGEGPIEDFLGDLSIALDGTEEIAGQIALRRLPEGLQIGLDLAGDLRTLVPPRMASFFGPATLLRATLTRGEITTKLDELEIRSAALMLDGSGELIQGGWPQRFSLNAQIGASDGAPVPVPLWGAASTLQAGQIALFFDESQGPAWTGQIDLKGLSRGDLSIGELDLDLAGEITTPRGGEPGIWSLSSAYRAEEIEQRRPEVAQALGTTLWGELGARGASGKPSQITHATLLGEGFQGRFSGQIGRSAEDYRAKLDARLNASELERLSGLAGRPLAGSAELRGRLEYGPLTRDLLIALEGQTQDLELGSARLNRMLKGTGRVTLRAERDRTGTRLDRLRLTTKAGTFAARADLTNDEADANFSLDIPDSSALSPRLDGPIVIVGEVTRADAGKSQLTVHADLPHGEARIEADLAPREDRYAGGITADFQIADLAPYSELAGRMLSGSGRAALRGTGHLAEGSFDMELKAETQDLGLGQTQLDALFAGPAQLEGRLLRDAEGTLLLRKLEIASPAMQGDAEGTLRNGQLTARLDAELPDASVLHSDMSGAVRLTGRARQLDETGTQVTLSATASDARMSLRADVPENGGALRYSATLDLAQLDQYRGLIGYDLAGRLWAQADGHYNPESGAGDLHLSGRSDNLRIGATSALPTKLMAGQSTLRLRGARDAAGNLSLDRFQLRNAQIEMAGHGQRQQELWSGQMEARLTDLGQLDERLSGPATLEIGAQGNEDGSTALQASGTGSGARLTSQIRVAPKSEDYAARFDAEIIADQLRPWSALLGRAVGGSGRITAAGRWLPRNGTLDAEMRLHADRIDTGNAILNRILAGGGHARARLQRDEGGTFRAAPIAAHFGALHASATAQVTGGSYRITNISAQLADIRTVHPALSGPVRLRGSITGRAQRSDLNLELLGVGGLNAQIRGGIAPGGTPDLSITGQAPLALANPIIAPQAASGTAQIALSLRGPGGLDALRGRISTTGSRLSIPQRNAALNNMSGTMDLNGARATVDLRANGLAGGTLALAGSVDLADQLRSDLRLRLGNVMLRDPALYETRLSGTLQILGTLANGGARISGDLELPRTEIRVPTRGIGGLSPLPEIRHINSPAPVRQTLRRAGLSIAGIDLRRGGDQQTGTGARDQIAYPLDIRLNAPGRIFLRGRGIDAELGGSLRLRGTSRRLVPSGRFSLIRGRLTILQQRFEFTDGYGALEGDFTPYIRLSAATERSGVTTFVTIEGDVSSPEVSFTSAPPLPEDEVLARLIFGQDLRNVSPLQAVQLASALNTLAGGSDNGIIGELRREIGLDDLDLTSDESGQAQIRAGKYLSEDIYADVAVNSEGESTVNLNLNLGPDVTVKGATSSTGQSSVGIFFERDY